MFTSMRNLSSRAGCMAFSADTLSSRPVVGMDRAFQILRRVVTGAGSEGNQQKLGGVMPESAPPMSGGWSHTTRARARWPSN